MNRRLIGALVLAVGSLCVLVLPLPLGQEGPRTGGIDPVVLLGIALTFWAIGVVVQLQKPDDGLARTLYWLNLAMAGCLALSSPAGNGVLWTFAFEMVAGGVLPALFLSFCLWLAADHRPRGLAALLVRLLLGIGLLVGSIRFWHELSGASDADPARMGVLALWGAGFLVGPAILAHAYLRGRSRARRQQLGVVLLGMAVAVLPLTILDVFPTLLRVAPLVSPQMAALTMIFLPFSLAYAVLRYRFLDIDLIVNRTLIYGTLTLVLAGYYALFLSALNHIGLERNAYGPLLTVLFFVVATLTFAPARNLIRTIIDQLIYRDRYDYASTLRELGAHLASVQPLDEVLLTVTEQLQTAMNLQGAAVLLRRPDGEFRIVAVSGDYPTIKDIEILRLDAASGRLGQRSESLIPLVAHGEESGFLYLGPKRSLARLSDEDLDLAQTLASQAAVAVANALLVERLRAQVAELELLRDRLLGVQEDERRRIAQELHDGALHTVLELVRRSDAGRASGPAAVDNGLATVQVRFHELAELGRDAADELRMIGAALYPSELTHLGLVASIDDLAASISRDENLLVHFTYATFPEDVRLADETEEALYRLVREALTNVIRHAAARTVSIVLSLDGDEVQLTVSDDGRGFVIPGAMSSLLKRGHVGLMSMRDRIERLGGAFQIQSAPGAGTQLVARVPCREREVAALIDAEVSA